jgi:hypothetical protein
MEPDFQTTEQFRMDRLYSAKCQTQNRDSLYVKPGDQTLDSIGASSCCILLLD